MKALVCAFGLCAPRLLCFVGLVLARQPDLAPPQLTCRGALVCFISSSLLPLLSVRSCCRV